MAEHRVLYELLSRGFSVLKPVGDRLPYDLVVEQHGSFARIQVKLAWAVGDNIYAVDTRRHLTNRKKYKRVKYTQSAFDVLVAWIAETDAFYVFSAETIAAYKSMITMNEGTNRRQARSAPCRGAWGVLDSVLRDRAAVSSSAS